MVAASVLPLFSSTVIVPEPPPAVATWLLVRMCPWLSMTKPDPVPLPSDVLIRIVTTLGSASAAILAMLPSGRAVEPGPGAGTDDPSVPVRFSSCCPPSTTAPPISAATRAIAAIGIQERPRWSARGEPAGRAAVCGPPCPRGGAPPGGAPRSEGAAECGAQGDAYG